MEVREVSEDLTSAGFKEILLQCRSGRKTGILLASESSIQKKIYFEGGMIVSCETNSPIEYLPANWMLQNYNLIEKCADNQQAVLNFQKTPDGWQVNWEIAEHTGTGTKPTLQGAVIYAANQIHLQCNAKPPERQDGIPVFE